MKPFPPYLPHHGRVMDLPRPEFPARICILAEGALCALQVRCPLPPGLAVGDLVDYSAEEPPDGETAVTALQRTGGPVAGRWDETGDALRWRLPGAPAPRMEFLRLRHRVVRELRDWFDGEGFLEVETPTLAAAPNPEPQFRPLRADGGYLITSPEFHLKRMVVGGFEKVYRLGPVFRGGEAGAHHNPEFTLVEWYRAHQGLEAMAADLEALLARLAPLAEPPPDPAPGAPPGNPALAPSRGLALDRTPFQTATMAHLFRAHLGMELGKATTAAALKAAALKASVPGAEGLPDDFEAAFFTLWDRIEPRLPREPLLVVDWPAPLASLARLKPGHPHLAERMELYAGGLELANGFAELTDPAEQRRRFGANLVQRQNQGLPALPLDEKFLAALDQGMPPTAGMAMGVERLVMLLSGATQIRQVLPFDWDER